MKKIDFECRLIREGFVEFRTNDIEATRKNIYEALKKFEAYASSDQEFKSTGRASNTIVVRVPAKSFDDLFDAATKDVRRFDSKEINVKDVTEEFLDIQARLKTKKELEARYVDLLKKAKTVTEMLEVESEIGKLRSEIESIEGRMRFLTDKISFSTLTLTFYQKISNETEFSNQFKIALQNGWENLIWFFVALANIWPFILIIVILVFVFRFIKKKKKK